MSRQGWLREHSIIIARAYTKQGVGGREASNKHRAHLSKAYGGSAAAGDAIAGELLIVAVDLDAVEPDARPSPPLLRRLAACTHAL